MTSDKKAKLLENLNRLRVLVGFLGEKGQAAWWDTSFLNKTGLQFLEINFPRTALSAGCNSVIEAAKRLHDDRIGKGGVYHLFRFPTVLEEDLHRNLLLADSNAYLPLLESKESAMEALAEMLKDTVGSPEGPVQIGIFKGMVKDSDILELAIHYYDAFRTEKMCFPYFTVSR